MRDLRNLTPHPIYFLDKEKNRVGMLEKCNSPIRLEQDRVIMESFDARVYCPECEGDTGKTCNCSDGTVEIEVQRGHKYFYPAHSNELPPEDGTIYIVPSIVAQSVDRDDFLVPNTIRDGEDGHVVGCIGLDEID